LNLAAGDIEDVPDMGNEAAAAYLLAVAKTKEGKVRILLDIDRILFSRELKRFEAAIGETEVAVGLETT
jgi:hypothetical protein